MCTCDVELQLGLMLSCSPNFFKKPLSSVEFFGWVVVGALKW